MTRTISTVEELDALPTRCIIADSINLPLRKSAFHWTYGKEPVDVEDIGLPATVLWEPTL